MQDPNYNGEDFEPDQDLANGPMAENRRSCTDILIGILFILFTCGMVAVAIWAFAKGQPRKLLSPIDSDGNFCGYTANYEDHKYLYFSDLTSKTALYKHYFCVKKCPEKGDTTVVCRTTTNNPTCTIPGAYKNSPYLGQYCLPDKDGVDGSVYEEMYDSLGLGLVIEYISDVIRSWPIVIMGVVAAFIISCIYLYLI